MFTFCYGLDLKCHLLKPHAKGLGPSQRHCQEHVESLGGGA